MREALILKGRTWQRTRLSLSFVMLFSFLLTGCAGKTAAVPMLMKASDSLSVQPQKVYRNQASGSGPQLSFASAQLCVPTEEDLQAGRDAAFDNGEISANAAFLFNLSDHTVVFAKNCYEKIYPASTTKLLTALMLLSYTKEHGIPLSETYVITEDNGGITRAGAKLFEFKKGDTVSLELLLNALLVYSANDAAVAILEYIAGQEGIAYEEAVAEMNALAAKVGATHTSFTNPHGLHEPGHQTTAYDLYLIFAACMEYEEFLPSVGMASYRAVYTGADGTEQEKLLDATNQYFLGLYEPPEGITVCGGKTGSTPYAGDCFITLSTNGEDTYLSAVFGAASYEELYTQMNLLLAMELSDDIKK